MVNVFIPKESRAGETRVAATPETVKKMVKAGLAVGVGAGAGAGAWIADDAFAAAGATIAADPAAARAAADVVLQVGPGTPEEARQLKAGAVLIGLLAPHQNPEVVRALAAGRVSAFAMELVPRISRAQVMDALSSQASIAGYKAVLIAAVRLGKYFPLLMTAAGTIPPARVVIMGAGVAGLQAVATARRLGAVVEVSDIREVVKEQVESLGGKFIPLPEREGGGEGEGGYAREMSEEFLRQQRAIVAERVAQADVVICTALVPGKKAPLLLSREMVEAMRPGSVIVDLAVSQGGNCELSQADEEVLHRGVLILGPSNLPAQTMATDASQLYARNVWALLESLIRDGEVVVDLDDEVVAGALLTHAGEIRHAPTRALVEGEQSS
ncbi:MAG: Re/Si-specific NAD(P)(+) transhydrogenase subunit alpha [Acidobacteria bacterium]|nr:MAG: Re/Si-specific NAD(P)(+) transhydrogenase subunit alpha [Acidobacteriota bacterium]